jgi:hypothetical protein
MIRDPQPAATAVISWDEQLPPIITQSNSELHRFHDLLRFFDLPPREARLLFVQIVRAFEETQQVIDDSKKLN